MNTTQKSTKKLGLNTLISWGASVVIIGLMFKLLHWRGGEWMIGLGLGVEACLFFLLGFAAFNDNGNTTVVMKKEEPQPQLNSEFENLLNRTINPKTIEKLNQGFDQFNKTVESVNQVTGYAGATKNMISEVENATKEMQELRKHLAELNTIYKAQLDAFRKN